VDTAPGPTNESGFRTLLVVASLLALGGTVFALRQSRPAPASGTSSAGVEALLVALTAQQRMASAGRVHAQCDGAAASCTCQLATLREALDAEMTDTARAFLADARTACNKPLAGEEAEVLVRAGAKEAEAAAQRALAATPSDPYANYAMAQLAWGKGDGASATRFANAAIGAGRGAPAQSLLGLVALAGGETEAARGAFVRALETEPNDAAALYDAALCDQKLNHYNAARSGYLAVLRLNPRHLDARFNLVLLANGAGFHDEAVHHLAELRAIAPPGDARVASLAAVVAATPAPSSAPTASAVQAPGGSTATP
jgi:tetratricopeptide (TPR) repeat protein